MSKEPKKKLETVDETDYIIKKHLAGELLRHEELAVWLFDLETRLRKLEGRKT